VQVIRLGAQCSGIQDASLAPPLASWKDLEPKADITFRRLGFTAKTKKGGRIEILRGASGYCRGGRLLAIAGPSGAGKVVPPL
jgi:hypothetical protein